MNVPSHCQRRTDQPIYKAKTPKAKSTFTLRNPKRASVVVLQPEEFFPAAELDCDFVFQVATAPLELYVELKGSDILHAIDQLDNAIRLLASPLRPKKCIIVVWQRSPPKSDTQMQNRKLAFERKHRCKLEWKTQHHTLSI